MRSMPNSSDTIERQSDEIHQTILGRAGSRASRIRADHSFRAAVGAPKSVAGAQPWSKCSESAPPEFANVDWLKFAEKFRGAEEDIRARQQMYASRFREHAPVLDLGCGRGEMLQILQDAGITARGIDSNDDSIALCVAKGLDAEKADLFAYLNDLPDASLGGVMCCQVVEHLPPARLPEMIRLVARQAARGRPGGASKLRIRSASRFSPRTSTSIPRTGIRFHRLLASFYLEEAGFGLIEIERLSPGDRKHAVARRVAGGVPQGIFRQLRLRRIWNQAGLMHVSAQG